MFKLRQLNYDTMATSQQAAHFLVPKEPTGSWMGRAKRKGEKGTSDSGVASFACAHMTAAVCSQENSKREAHVTGLSVLASHLIRTEESAFALILEETPLRLHSLADVKLWCTLCLL